MKNYTKLLFALCLFRAGTAFTKDSEFQEAWKYTTAQLQVLKTDCKAVSPWIIPGVTAVVLGSCFGKAGHFISRFRSSVVCAGALILASELLKSGKLSLEERVSALELQYENFAPATVSGESSAEMSVQGENADLPECFDPKATSQKEKTPLETLENAAEEKESRES